MDVVKQIILIGGMSIGVGVCVAAPAPLSPSLYYEVGGGSSYERPLNEATIAPSIGISGDLNLPLNCDIWDVKDIAIANYPDLIVDYLEGELDRLGQAVVAQLTSIGQGLAVAALQRALPGIYDLSQTLTSQINARVEVAKNSCESVVNDIQANGISAIDPWKNIGKSFSWRTSLTGPTSLDSAQPVANPDAGGAAGPTTAADATSIIDASRFVAAQGSSEPIPWLSVELAGSTTNPIMMVSDLVTAGYNIFLDQDGGEIESTGLTTDASAAGITADLSAISGEIAEEIRLGTLFGDTDAAVDWANRFIGEQEIYTCEDAGCESGFRPGVGLQVMVNDEVKILVELWDGIIADNDPSLERLGEVSSGSVVVTSFLYEALMRFPLQDQNVYIGRLINDVALSRTVEKALAIRRMMLVSSESPVVKGYAQASVVADQILDRIKTEIEDIMWTVQTQKKLSSAVAESVLAYDAVRSSNAPSSIISRPIDGTSDFIGDRPVSPTP